MSLSVCAILRIVLASGGAFAGTVCLFRWLRRRRERKLYGSM